MKKFLKNIAAAVAATAVVSTFVVGVASAEAQDYVGYSKFGPFSLADKGGRAVTNSVQKDDYYDYAVVYFEGNYPSPYAPVYFRTITEDGQLATVDDTAMEPGRYTLDYKSGMGNYGDYYKLSMNAGYSGTTVSGKWAP